MKKTSIIFVIVAVIFLAIAVINFQLREKPSYYKELCESFNGTWGEFEYKGYNVYFCYTPQIRK
jgi:hypothetical protein